MKAQNPQIHIKDASRHNYLALAVITLAALSVLAWQFIHPGFYYLADDDAGMLPKYVPQIIESFTHGVLYPRWMQHDYRGYGSPAFVYYAPLYYQAASLIHLLGVRLDLCALALEFARLFTGACFVYLLVKEGYGTRAGLAASLFYILLPARVMDMYYWNSPAGRFSEAFLPMSAYFAYRFSTKPFSRSRLLWAGLSYSCLVLTHLPTAYIFTPFLAAYGILAGKKRVSIDTAAKAAMVICSGLMISAFYLLPVLFERGEVHIDAIGIFTYHGNFLFGSDSFAGGNREDIRFMISRLVAIEVTVTALFIVTARQFSGLRLKADTGFYIVAAAICIFMMSSFSNTLWNHLPGLSTLQFPSRFEPVSLLFISAVLGISTEALIATPNRFALFKVIIVVVVVAVIALDTKLITASNPYSEDKAKAVAKNLELPEYLPERADPAAVNDIEAKTPFVSSKSKTIIDMHAWGPANRKFNVISDGALLAIRTFYFPGWKAWVDGAEVPIGVQDKTGAILIDVPAGKHSVELKFTDTWPRKAGWIISIATLVLLVFPYGRLRLLQGRAV